MDRRARDYARNGQKLLASDLIFSDGFEKSEAAVTALEQTRDAEAGRARGGNPSRPAPQMLAAAAAAATGLALLLALLPLPSEPPAFMPAELSEPSRRAGSRIAPPSRTRPGRRTVLSEGARRSPAYRCPRRWTSGISPLCAPLSRASATRRRCPPYSNVPPRSSMRRHRALDCRSRRAGAEPDRDPWLPAGPRHTARHDSREMPRTSTASAFRTSLLQTVPA